MDRDTRIVFLEKQPKFSKITKAVYDNACMLEIVSTNEPSICSMNQSEDCHCKKGEACADILISDISKSYLSNIDFIEKRIKKGCRVKYHAILTDTWSDTQLKRIKNLKVKVFYKPMFSYEISDWVDTCLKKNIRTVNLATLFEN